MAIESFGALDAAQYTSNLGSIASGSRTNQASNDPAGQAIVTSLTATINTQNAAVENANTGISLVQSADGASQSISDQLQRLNELSLQASNGTYSDAQRRILNEEFNQGLQSINQIAESTSFNGLNLLNGENSNISIALGSGSSDITLPDFTLNGLGLTGLDITTAGNAENALTQLTSAFESFTESRSTFGAEQNGLSSAINNITNANLSTLATRSQINDTDFARASAEQSRLNILNQAGIALQSQANLDYRNVLTLLQ